MHQNTEVSCNFSHGMDRQMGLEGAPSPRSLRASGEVLLPVMSLEAGGLPLGSLQSNRHGNMTIHVPICSNIFQYALMCCNMSQSSNDILMASLIMFVTVLMVEWREGVAQLVPQVTPDRRSNLAVRTQTSRCPSARRTWV